jgi:hypothetical protein
MGNPVSVAASVLVFALAGCAGTLPVPRVSAESTVPPGVVEFVQGLAKAVALRDMVALEALLDERGLICGDGLMTPDAAASEIGRKGTKLNAYFFDTERLRVEWREVDVKGNRVPKEALSEFFEHSKEVNIEAFSEQSNVPPERTANFVGIILRSKHTGAVPVLYLQRGKAGGWRLRINPMC